MSLNGRKLTIGPSLESCRSVIRSNFIGPIGYNAFTNACTKITARKSYLSTVEPARGQVRNKPFDHYLSAVGSDDVGSVSMSNERNFLNKALCMREPLKGCSHASPHRRGMDW